MILYLIINTMINDILKIFHWIFSINGSQVIHNLGLGIGSFIGGLAGLKIVSEWIEKRKREKLIERYTSIYRIESINIDWELTKNPVDPKKNYYIYVLNNRTKTKHWIANWETFEDLSFPQNQIEQTEDKTNKFNSYNESHYIITTGKPRP